MEGRDLTPRPLLNDFYFLPTRQQCLLVSPPTNFYIKSSFYSAPKHGGAERVHADRDLLFFNCRCSGTMSPERGRRNPDWGSIFRKAKFRLCPNGTNFMSFQHYSAPRVWWRAQFLHLSFWFFSHFWKWVMPVSDFCMWAVVFHFLDATRLMVFSDSAAELLSLQQMAAWGIWGDFQVLLSLCMRVPQ